MKQQQQNETTTKNQKRREPSVNTWENESITYVILLLKVFV